MEQRKALLISDSAPQPEWDLRERLSQQTSCPWELWHANSRFEDSAWKKKAKYFLLPLRLLRRRREYSTILSYQQFYGLVYAFYCELFRLKKCGCLLIATFIYRPKEGAVGWLYFRFVRRAVRSRAVDRILCYSASEVPYYEALFDVRPGKFVAVPLGLGDAAPDAGKTRPSAERYILSAGKSNRDYDFLSHALAGSPYPVHILCGDAPCPHAENFRIERGTYGQAYFEQLARCFCVVIPLREKHISSGQLALLQAQMFSKPVIATRTDTTQEYIRDGETGFLVETPQQLQGCLRRLYTQPQLYERIAQNGRRAFLQQHSVERMARAIGEILRKLQEENAEL